MFSGIRPSCDRLPQLSAGDGPSKPHSTVTERPDVLDPDELREVASYFRVDEAQMLRDQNEDRWERDLGGQLHA
jgi:hypothetical protein